MSDPYHRGPDDEAARYRAAIAARLGEAPTAARTSHLGWYVAAGLIAIAVGGVMAIRSLGAGSPAASPHVSPTPAGAARTAVAAPSTPLPSGPPDSCLVGKWVSTATKFSVTSSGRTAILTGDVGEVIVYRADGTFTESWAGATHLTGRAADGMEVEMYTEGPTDSIEGTFRSHANHLQTTITPGSGAVVHLYKGGDEVLTRGVDEHDPGDEATTDTYTCVAGKTLITDFNTPNAQVQSRWAFVPQ